MTSFAIVLALGGFLLAKLCYATPPVVIQQLLEEVKACKGKWKELGVLGKRNREALCRPQIIKYQKAFGIYPGADMRSQRIVKGLDGSRPCLTPRAADLCRQICGRALWELGVQEVRSVIRQTPSRAGWTQHPWINGCVRNRWLDRCGPDGIHCWSNQGLAKFREGVATLQSIPNLEPNKGVMLEDCDYQGEWNQEAMTNENLLRFDGFPSMVNLRAEKVHGDPLLHHSLRVDIQNWKEWESAAAVQPLRVFGGAQTDPAAIELELRFTRDIRGVVKNSDTSLKWAKYAQDLTSRYVAADRWVEMDLPLGQIMEQSGNYYSPVPNDTKPYPLWVYYHARSQVKSEVGLEKYIDAATVKADDYLRPEKCLPNQEVLDRVVRLIWASRDAYNQEQWDTVEGNLGLLAALASPKGYFGTEAGPPGGVPKDRTNRSLPPPSTVTREATKPTRKHQPLNLEVKKWFQGAGRHLMPEESNFDAPSGLATELRATWEEHPDDSIWGRMKNIAGHYEINSGALPGLQWVRSQEVTPYDQHATLELTTPLSPVVDTVDDLVYHLKAVGKQALRSPGRLQDLEGLDDSDLQAKLEQFRIYEQASMNHLIEMDNRVSQQCQRRMHVAIAQQGFTDPTSGGLLDPQGERDRRAVSTLVAGALGVITGISGYIAGLVTATPHAGAHVTGLRGAVATLHHRTSAMLRSEALIKIKLQDAEQGLGAARRGAMTNAATLAVCEGSHAVVDGLREIRRGRTPLGLFYNTTEMIKVLQELEDEVLVPHELRLLLKAEEYPEQLLLWQAGGYIESVPRVSPLGLGNNATEYLDNGVWSHNGTTELNDSITLSDEARRDVLDNLFMGAASHLGHAQGMRKDYLTHIWNLKVNLKVPAKGGGDQTYVRMEPADPIFEIGNQTLYLDLQEVLLQSTTGAEAVSLGLEELGTCTQITATGRTFCPREVLIKTQSCGLDLLHGKLTQRCLDYIKTWPVHQPYCHNIAGGLQYLVYIPPEVDLKVRCGRENLWTTRPEKGLKKLTLQPSCQLRMLDQITTVLPRLEKEGTLWIQDMNLDLGAALMHAEFFQKVKWKSVEAELYTLTNQTAILSEVFERLEEEANKNGMTKLRESLPLWGWLATLFGTSGLLALLYFTGCCCGHHCRNHLRRMIVKTQEGEDELWESITELKEQGRINLNSLSEKVSLLTGQIDQIHVRMDSELPSARKIPARKKLETPKSTEVVNIRANPGLGGLQFSPGKNSGSVPLTRMETVPAYPVPLPVPSYPVGRNTRPVIARTGSPSFSLNDLFSAPRNTSF